MILGGSSNRHHHYQHQQHATFLGAIICIYSDVRCARIYIHFSYICLSCLSKIHISIFTCIRDSRKSIFIMGVSAPLGKHNAWSCISNARVYALT